MMLLSQATQQVHAYSPDDIANAIVKVIGAMALVLIPALVALWKAVKDSSQAKLQSEQNSKQIVENRAIATSQLQAINSNVVKVAAHMPVPPKLEDFQEGKVQ